MHLKMEIRTPEPTSLYSPLTNSDSERQSGINMAFKQVTPLRVTCVISDRVALLLLLSRDIDSWPSRRFHPNTPPDSKSALRNIADQSTAHEIFFPTLIFD